MILVWLAAGGVLGTWARYGLTGWVTTGAQGEWPWGTFAVNVLGSFVLGLVLRSAEIVPLSPELRLFLTVGFCGAFTTFSTFSYETLALLQQGAWLRAGLYSFGSLAIALLALVAGLTIAAPLIHRLN